MKLSATAVFILIFFQFCARGQAPDIIINSITPNQTAYCTGDSVTISFSVVNFVGSNNFAMSMSKSAFSVDSTAMSSVTVSGSPTTSVIGYRFKNQDADIDSAYQLRIKSGGTISALLPLSGFIVNLKPVAVASVTSQTVCSGVFISTVSFSTGNNVANTTFSWSRNNTTNVSGAASGTGDINFTYLVNNTTTNQTVTYTIIPTGPLPSSCAGSPITSTVIVKPAPVVTMVTEDTICSGGGFSLPYTVSIPSSVIWFAYDNVNTIGEDLNFRSANPLKDSITNLTSVDQIVTYAVIATSTSGNCQGSEVDVNITVSPQPDATFAVSDTTPCSGDTINFVLSDTMFNSLIWTWGDGSPNTNCTGCFAVKHKYSSSAFPSVRTAQLIAVNANGCRDTSRTSVFVKPNPHSNFAVNDNTQCLDAGSNQFTFSDRSTIADSLNNLLTYLWNFGDSSPFETTKDAGHSYAVADSYFVYHKVTTLFGCSDSVSKLMVVYQNPQTQIKNNTGSDTLCGASSITLSADSGYTYLWSNSRTTRNITVRDSVLSNSSTYTVTVTDNHLCTASASREITTNPPLPKPEIGFDTSLLFCAGAKAQLFDIKNPADATYTWNSFSDGLSFNSFTGAQFNTDLPTLPGDTFTVTVWATDNVTGCTNSDSVTIYVSQNEAPVAGVVIDLSTLICTNNTVKTYQWGYDDAGMQEHTLSGETLQSYYVGSNPDVNVSGKYYWVKITDAGGCQSKIYYQSPPSYVTGILSIHNENISIRVYPNPTSSLFKIEAAGYTPGIKTVEVCNTIGAIMYKESFGNTMMINAHEWKNGVYFVKVISEDGVYKTIRIIKL